MKLLFLLTIFPLFCTENVNKNQLAAPSKGFAVVELFTSEGCSSCPPADNLMKEIKEQYDQKDVLILSYHVDYWDKLGWKDRFSSAANTERQSYYAELFHLESIYTPQVVVNGQKEFVGSDKGQLFQSIKTGKENRNFNIAAEKKNNKISVTVSNTNLKKDEQVLIALVQTEASTQVGTGENGGKQLHHVNIVRDYKILENKNSFAEFTSAETDKSQLFIATLIQNRETGEILAFNTAPIKS